VWLSVPTVSDKIVAAESARRIQQLDPLDQQWADIFSAHFHTGAKWLDCLCVVILIPRRWRHSNRSRRDLLTEWDVAGT
jgi:hypothetical protein